MKHLHSLLKVRLLVNDVFSLLVYAPIILLCIYFFAYAPEQRRHHDAFNLDSNLVDSITFSPKPSLHGDENKGNLVDKDLTIVDYLSISKVANALESAEHVSRKAVGLNEIRTECRMFVDCGDVRYNYSISVSRNKCLAFFRNRCYLVDALEDVLVDLLLKDPPE